VDFIDKQDILAAQVGKNRGKVSGTLDGRTGRRFDINADFGGNNMSQACLAETGRAVKKDMVKGFAAASGRGNSYLEIFFSPVLSGEIGKTTRSEAGIERCILGAGFSRYNTSYLPHPLSGLQIA
jgi:hypothetical protein